MIRERKGDPISKEYEKFISGILKSILEEAASLSNIHVQDINRKGVATPMVELIGFTRSDFEVNVTLSGWMNKTNEITIIVFVSHSMAGDSDFELEYNVYRTSVSDIAQAVSGGIPL